MSHAGVKEQRIFLFTVTRRCSGLFSNWMSHAGVMEQRIFYLTVAHKGPGVFSNWMLYTRVQENQINEGDRRKGGWGGELLNTFECHWTLLKTVECYWTLLNTIEHCWTLLNTIERYWTLLNTIEHDWMLMNTMKLGYMALWRFGAKGWMEWSGYPKENISCIDWLASSSLMSQYCLPNSGNENISESWRGTCVHIIGLQLGVAIMSVMTIYFVTPIFVYFEWFNCLLLFPCIARSNAWLGWLERIKVQPKVLLLYSISSDIQSVWQSIAGPLPAIIITGALPTDQLALLCLMITRQTFTHLLVLCTCLGES